ncbi:FecR family protein [bacterium]|nr:FecR family protein [bacterium]
MKSTIKNYLSGKSSSTEQKELLDWLREEDHISEFQTVKEEWKEEIIAQEHSSEYRQNWTNIQDSIYGGTQAELFQAKRTLRIFQYAAIFVLLISVPAIIFMMQSKSTDKQLIYTTVAADFGQISKVILPDSTVVWVNSGSKLTYNNQFSASNRDIQLTGEAYFKVTKNKDLPLVVASGDLRIKVLGTEFCVSAYSEEKDIQVVLEKGKVELSTASQVNLKQEMKPGELVSFSKAKKEMVLSTVNTGLFTSWKDGLINIYNLPLSDLVIRLEKRYNQKFLVDEEIKNLPYTFTIKNEDLSSILSLMEKITPVDVIQRENVIELKYNQKKVIKVN